MKVNRINRDALRRLARDTGLPGIVPALVVATQYDRSAPMGGRRDIARELWEEFQDDDQAIGRFAILLQEPANGPSRGTREMGNGLATSLGSELDSLLGEHIASGVARTGNEVIALGGVFPEPGYGLSIAYESVRDLSRVLNRSLQTLPDTTLALLENVNAQRDWNAGSDGDMSSVQVNSIAAEIGIVAQAWETTDVAKALATLVRIQELTMRLGSRTSKSNVLERVRKELNWRHIGITANKTAIEGLSRSNDASALAIALDPVSYDAHQWPAQHARVLEQLTVLIGAAGHMTGVQERMDNLRAALACQAEASQAFLFALEEHAGHSKGVETRLIAWDPVRAVAARAARAPYLDEPSVRQRVNDMLSPADRVDVCGKAGVPVSAALLADLLAFVALNRGVTPRRATALLLDRLGGRAVLESVQFGYAPQRNAWTEQVEVALVSIGWRPEPDEWVSLRAACSVPESQLDAIVLRKASEGFVKDVVLLLAQEHILGGVVAFERHIRSIPEIDVRGSLKEELNDLTVGKALAWLQAVSLKLLLDDRQRALLPTLFGALEGLNRLNKHVHNTSDVAAPLPAIAAFGKSAIEAAIAIFGDLPWRLSVRVRHGTFPTIVTGVGRNHAHAAEAPLRFLCADGEEKQSEIVIWNPTRQNPVITAGRVLRL